jgi:hypothetical protein
VKVRYIPLSLALASARLRGLIPARELRKLGFEVVVSGPADWAVLSKHGWDDDRAEGAKRIAFDVCDDHFDGEHSAHYFKWCAAADLVTCNSAAMAEIIKARTGRDARVIPDPYESPECEPKCHAPVLWFGQALNLLDLMPILDRLPETLIVSDHDHPRIARWTPQTMEAAWDTCGLTVLPTGAKKGKSANRAIESIRRGLFPVCGHLPAYAELGLGVDDVPAAVADALENKGHTLERVFDLQDLIRDKFSPGRIGKLWAECF